MDFFRCSFLNVAIFAPLFLAAAILTASAGPLLTIQDLNERSLEIELIAVERDQFHFYRVGEKQRFTLPFTKINEASRQRIREEAKHLAAEMPDFETNVVIGKRRNDRGSYYMENQTISCTVTLTSNDRHRELPATKARVLFFGQNQMEPEIYIVLSVQDFNVSLKPTESNSYELKTFVTRYDNWKKGDGNVGGYMFSGYLLVFLNERDEVIYHFTNTGSVRTAVENKHEHLQAVSRYAVNTGLDAALHISEKNIPPIK
ncbi:MAG: hypothetical protein EAZ42_07585 [Verrucomicrobia bacterium]|nr:MAG: hypothetical protein EAZ42_07585 [Verrucomicrobiota bacterium]